MQKKRPETKEEQRLTGECVIAFAAHLYGLAGIDDKSRVHIRNKPRLARCIKGKTAVGPHRHGGWGGEIVFEGEIRRSRTNKPNSMNDNTVQGVRDRKSVV